MSRSKCTGGIQGSCATILKRTRRGILANGSGSAVEQALCRCLRSGYSEPSGGFTKTVGGASGDDFSRNTRPNDRPVRSQELHDILEQNHGENVVRPHRAGRREE